MNQQEFLIKIRNFRKQFLVPLEFVNFKPIKKKKYLLCGMGGSHLAGDLLKVLNPKFDLIIHSDYNLPKISDLKERLAFIVSYSGDTQETISSLKSALRQKLDIRVITLNGKLLKFANAYKIPLVILPDLNLQPRLGVGLMLRALLKIINHRENQRLENFIKNFKYQYYEKIGKKIIKDINNKIPIIYSSYQNLPLANYFKISFNETSKIPAFINYFPELNHNEMVSWFYNQKNSRNFYFIFLYDDNDNVFIRKRMIILKQMLQRINYRVKLLKFSRNVFEKIILTIYLSFFSSYYLAKNKKIDPSDQSLIEKFKSSLKFN